MGSLPLIYWVIMGALGYGLYWMLTPKKIIQGDHVCPSCGTTGEPTIVTKGSIAIEIILWLCFIVPGIIYSVWRLTSKYSACPACKQAGMIPVHTPNGKKLVAQFKNTVQE